MERWIFAAFGALACALAGCSEDPLVETELPACRSFRDGHWDRRLVTPGASGLGARVVAIVRMPDGSVIAGGTFDAMSGIGAKNIARWDGHAWSPLADGLPGQVASIAVDDAGQLWAVGRREATGGREIPFPTASSYLARWTGTQWTYVVQAATNIEGVIAIDDGIAVFGSYFPMADLPGNGLAVLRNGAWSTLDAVSGTSLISAARAPNGLCVGGIVTTPPQSLEGVVCWNGTTWSQLGNEKTIPQALARGRDGTWYAGGSFTVLDGINERRGIARFDVDDNHWHSLDGGIAGHTAVATGGDKSFLPSVSSISIDGDDVVIAGHFEWVGAVDPKTPQAERKQAFNLARWNPTTSWSAMTAPIDLFGELFGVLAMGDTTYVGGAFVRIGLQPGAGIASVTAEAVHSLPESTSAPARLGQIGDLVAQPDGILIAGRFKDSIEEIDTAAMTHGLLQFDGTWHVIEDVPGDFSVSAIALGDGSYAIRTGTALYRRLSGQPAKLLCCGADDKSSVVGPLVADGNGTLFFVVADMNPTGTSTRIVRATADDTSFYASVPDNVVAMAIYEGELYVIVSSITLGGETVYRRHDDEWQLIGAWNTFTNSLVTSPALGLVAASQDGVRVWNGTEWRQISTVPTIEMAACSDGVVAAIDDGDGTRLGFLGDLDGEWTLFGEPRAAPAWQILPTANGIYVGSTFPGSGEDAPLGFARWTTLDDTGW
jgi:hypothetical protein